MPETTPHAMSLVEYRRKRDFARTREPEPGGRRRAAARPIFVVQLHHASRRHYDFRLQIGDALKSWAVPKGPSFDPSVKRLAAEVEDHPLSYATFEGEIPAGQYGGGHVARFDRGLWSTDGDPEAQLAKGHLRFELFGERLKGAWHLVRTRRGARQPEWLLFKDEDEYAAPLEADDLLEGVTPPPAGAPAPAAARSKAKRAPAAMRARARRADAAAPRTARRRRDWSALAAKLAGARRAKLSAKAFEPQLARLGEAPPAGDGWLHELKWDGYRLLTTIVGGRVRLWSRNAIEWTAKLPDVVAALERLGLREAALDGELIAGAGGQQDFGLLQSTLSGETQAPLNYVLFDLLHLDGVALDRVPLLARKTLLAQLLDPLPRHLGYSSHSIGNGAAAIALASERGFEGIISKRADQPYRGGRGDDWRKTKRMHSDEYAVVGWTEPKGTRTGFGSLLLARPDPEHGWRYVGRVGSGFSDAQLRALAPRLKGRGERTPSVHVAATDTDLRHAHWFAPAFVVEVHTRGTGNQGLLRQPSLKAIRMDKQPQDLLDSDRAPASRRRASAAKAPSTRAAGRRPTGAAAVTKTPRGRRAAPSAPEDAVRLSSPDRVVYPDSGITKQQVADYYLSVQDRLLAEIGNRPLSIIRCPDGSTGACFFQKHLTPGLKHVDKVRLKEESGNNANYLVVNDATALRELVQFNALEFHPWGSKADCPERADRIVFDLDPGPGVGWAAIKRAAREVRDRLEQVGLVSFLRTSGGKGLHVVVPLDPGCSWTLVKRFARGFAEAMVQQAPDRYVATATKALREGRIFIDYLRNGRGATSVASYSLRARPGAPVAMPLDWSELARLKSAAAFDLHSAPRRLARLEKDPWRDIDRIRQDLSRWSDGATTRKPRR